MTGEMYHHGQMIREYRLKRGMSQTALAEYWPGGPKNTRYIQYIESGERQVEPHYPVTKHKTPLRRRTLGRLPIGGTDSGCFFGRPRLFGGTQRGGGIWYRQRSAMVHT